MGAKLNKEGIASGHAFLVIAIALILITSVAWYFSTSGKAPSAGDNAPEAGESVGIELGQMAPNFTLVGIDGKTFSLRDYRGKVVVIDLMATWCGPCVAQMGHLKQVYSNYGDKVVIMSIDVDPNETNETIGQFKASYGDEWIFASGPNVGITYEVIYIPTMYIIDQRGRIVYKNVGVTPYSTLSVEIDKLL